MTLSKKNSSREVGDLDPEKTETMADQHERAFQKQDAIFVGAKRTVKGKKTGKLQRYYKNVGLSIATPKVLISFIIL